MLNGLVQFEVSKRACPSSMNDSLGDTFVVETGDLVGISILIHKSGAVLTYFLASQLIL